MTSVTMTFEHAHGFQNIFQLGNTNYFRSKYICDTDIDEGPIFTPGIIINENNTDELFWMLSPYIPLEHIDEKTEEIERPHIVDEAIMNTMSDAIEIVFTDGVMSEFIIKIQNLIYKYENLSIDALIELISSGKINPEIASEILRWIGDINNPNTYRSRLFLLINSLSNNSARIRDGALLGLSYINDPDTKKHILKAADKEPIKELREDMLNMLSYLK